jgi:hypothetical protein
VTAATAMNEITTRTLFIISSSPLSGLLPDAKNLKAAGQTLEAGIQAQDIAVNGSKLRSNVAPRPSLNNNTL